MTGGFYAPLTGPLNALILRSVIIYIIFFMLENRNWARFKNHKPNTVFTINKIKSHVFLTRNNIIQSLLPPRMSSRCLRFSTSKSTPLMYLKYLNSFGNLLLSDWRNVIVMKLLPWAPIKLIVVEFLEEIMEIFVGLCCSSSVAIFHYCWVWSNHFGHGNCNAKRLRVVMNWI